MANQFGYMVGGLENLTSGKPRPHTVFGAGISDIPWVCLGSGSSYARPLMELILAPGDLHGEETAKILPTLFTLVSNVQTAVGDGIDICIIADDRGPSAIAHEKEANPSGFRSDILRAMDVRL